MQGKNKGWIIKIQRPEELYESPNEYYTEEEVEKYANSSHMKRTQQKLTLRLVDLLGMTPPAKVLDIGCAVGYSTETLKELGFDVIGFDINENMVNVARAKGLKVVKGDMRELDKYFEKDSFNYIISTSTLQWIKDMNEIRKIAKGINYLLKPHGGLGIQFYPRSEEELNMIYWKFRREGFDGDLIIENPNSPKKRTVYLIMRKK